MSPDRATLGKARKSRIEQWERQPGEPPGAFEQFLLYLHQPRGERSVKESYLEWKERRTGVRPVSKHPPGSYHDIARNYQWEARALAFDRASDRKIHAKLDARRAKSMLERVEMGSLMMARATTALRMLVPVTQTIGERDGREVVLVETKIKPMEIARLLQVGAKLELLAFEAAAEGLKQLEGDDNPLTWTADSAKDELQRRIREARERRELAERAAEDRPGDRPDTE